MRRLNRCRGRSGFSLIELLVVVGVVVILIGLALPAMSRSFARARQTRSAVATRQAIALLELYSGAWREFYPVANERRALGAAKRFYKPLVDAGYIERDADIDPDGVRVHGKPNIRMSMALVFDHALMRPGQTLPEIEQLTRAVRRSEVAMPAFKGAICSSRVSNGEVWTTWCCMENAPAGPVGFCDGSVGVYRSAELKDGTFYIENGIGAPVFSTWLGVKGQDRQQ